MGFRLVPKSVTLNDPERRNGHYLAEFGSFRGQLRRLISHQQICSRDVTKYTDEARRTRCILRVSGASCLNYRHL